MSRNDHLSDKSAATAAVEEEEMEFKPSIRDQIVWQAPSIPEAAEVTAASEMC